MGYSDCLLALKANNALFNFIQQGTILLMFSSSVLSYFAFSTKNQEMKNMIKEIGYIAYGMWCLTFVISSIVLLCHIEERRFEVTRNVWGEIRYKKRKNKSIFKKKQAKEGDFLQLVPLSNSSKTIDEYL